MSGLRSDGEEIPIMFRLSQVECEEKTILSILNR